MQIIPTSPMATIDYNNLYTTGANLAFWNNDIDVLATWKSQSSFGQHSLSEFPNFVSNTNLRIDLNNPHLNGAATPISQILTDFDGETRDASTPDIGADEYIYTNIQEWKEDNLVMKLFPNPSKGHFSTTFETVPNNGYTIEIFSIDGKKIMERESHQNVESFFISDAGLYLINIKIDDKLKSFKLIIGQ